MLVFLCLAISKFGNQYVPIWSSSLNSVALTPFDVTYVCPVWFRSVFRFNNLVCYGQCNAYLDFTYVDKNGLGDCVVCDAGCDYCSYPTLRYCAYCKPGYVIYPDLKNPIHDTPRSLRHSCGLDTPCNITNGYFRDWTDVSCKACHSSCDTCWGTSANDCLSCPPHSYLTTSRSCIECDASCSTCSDAATCASCPAAFHLVNGQCISSLINLEHTVPIVVVSSTVTKTIYATVTNTFSSVFTVIAAYLRDEHFNTIIHSNTLYSNNNSTVHIMHPDCNTFNSTTLYLNAYRHDLVNSIDSNATTFYNTASTSFTNVSRRTTTLGGSSSCTVALARNTAAAHPTTHKPVADPAYNVGIMSCIATITSYVTSDTDCKLFVAPATVYLATTSVCLEHTSDFVDFKTSGGEGTVQSTDGSFASGLATSAYSAETPRDVLDYTHILLSTAVLLPTMKTTYMASSIQVDGPAVFEMSSVIAFASNPMFILLAVLICAIFLMFASILNIQKQKISMLIEQMQNVEMNVAIADQVVPLKLVH
eukprot:NODE_491_length_7770_cov_0.866771.p1 type:complete len:534 gc:universal NODE_491_length_7770_cov_0.866771:1765-3366(+)